MVKFLIVYATEEGQTKKISEFMKKEISLIGYDVDIYNCNDNYDLIIHNNYAGIIIGGSVHKGNLSKELTKWVINNATVLSNTPSAFFSVCLGILEKGLVAQDDERRIVIDFFDEVSWYPGKTTIFAGALKYSKYGWFTKWMMKKIAGKAGGATDTSKDYEYTDWSAVREFTIQFVRQTLEQKEVIPPFSRMSNPKRTFL
ncbi:MAG: flavodoxin domain-containing protein [Bdellovibrionota bacterium]